MQPTPGDPGSWAHEVAVTGIEYDENGEVVAYIVNDTGAGTCGQRLTKAQFERAIEPQGRLTVADKPIW